MLPDNTHRIPTLDYLLHVLIVALAFYIAFIPPPDYPYPVHIDEWVHLAYSQAMVQAGDTTFIDPFYGQATINLSSNLEAGFHLFWGVFHQISGISWLSISRYFPGIIFMITVLSVYILARRQGFGWEAALFTCLILTTVGILGPGFLVPVAMGLLFIPLSFFLAFNFKTVWSYLVLFIFTCFLLSIHAPSAICLVIVLIPYILLNIKGNPKHSLGIALALAIPFLVPFLLIFDMLLPMAKSLLTPSAPSPLVDYPRIIQTYGYLPILFCLLGVVLLAIRGGTKSYGLILALLALLMMLITFFTFHYGLQIMYTRGLMYLMLMMSIIAGAGLMGVRIIKLPSKLADKLKPAFLAKNLGNILCLVLIGLTLAIAIPARQHTPYYHMIDEEDYQAFVWIKDNIDESYEKAILDPWKATAFTAITGKNIFSKIHMAPKPSDEEARKFLSHDCKDTDFLKANEISIVYTRGHCDNPDLVKVRSNVYLLKETTGTK